MMQKVEDLKSEPVVGKFYLVRCIRSKTYSVFKSWDWRPIIGNQHEDAEHIQFDRQHYHYDVRFFYERQLKFCPSSIWSCAMEAQTMISVQTQIEGATIEYRRRKCFRRMPDFPLFDRDGKKSRIAVNLENAYKDVEMKCMKCPHRGFDLSSLPVKDGVVVCNGHGLAWNVKTGKMVPREN